MLSINPADMAARLGDPAPPIASVPSLIPEAKPKLGTPQALPATLSVHKQDHCGCMRVVGFTAPNSNSGLCTQ